MSKELSDLLNLFKQKNYIKAEKKCVNLIKKIKPNHEIFNIYAVILYELKKYNDSIKYWKKAIELNQNYYYAYNNIGNVFLKQKKLNEALENYDKALQLKPDYFEAHYNKGNVFVEMDEEINAMKCFDKALQIKNDYLPALKSRNKLFIKQKNLDRALSELDKIMYHESNNPNSYVQKGDIFYEKNNFPEAVESYKTAYNLKSDHPFLLGNIIHSKTKYCDWENFIMETKKLEEDILNNKKASSPYVATTLFDSPRILFESAKIWEKNARIEKKIHFKFSKTDKKKIKLGFFSADFRTHAMGHLMVQMLESHDKSLFELYGFYFGPNLNDKDLLQKRIIKCFDGFYNIKQQNDESVINLTKKIGIDLAIDLMGHTGSDNRFGIFLNKIAPIQINFLGYPGTSGSNLMDYIVADKILIPEKNQEYYSEKIIYLPDTYQANEDTKKISDKPCNKKLFGLPENKFIFCSFNANHKISPSIFELWMKILSKNTNSVLWILIDDNLSKVNLINYASKLGIENDQLIFANQLPHDEHLQRLKLADLVLDTFPYNAHTTCSDALRVNTPILTLKGESFASRVASSLLNSIGVTELIVETINDYENLALKISRDEEYLSNIRNKIEKNKLTSNLFKSKIYTKNLEKGYITAYKNYLKGESPKNIEL